MCVYVSIYVLEVMYTQCPVQNVAWEISQKGSPNQTDLACTVLGGRHHWLGHLALDWLH